MTTEQQETLIKWVKHFAKHIAGGIIGAFIILYFFTNVFGNKEITPDEMAQDMEKDLNGMMTVFYDSSEDLYQLDATDPDLIEEIEQLLIYHTGEESWDGIAKDLAAASERIEKRTGKDSAIMVMNPAYPELYLLLVQDGEILYDVTNDYY